MKNFLKMIATAILGLGLSLSAATVTVTYNGSKGYVSNGYHVGPVSLTVDGVSMEGYCYDFYRPVTTGNTWTANVYELSGLIVGDGFFDDPFLYKQEAWLASNYGTNSNPEWENIQFAAWNLLNTSAPDVSGQSGYLISAALQAPSFNASGWYALEDVNGEKQSFLVHVSEVPEPATLLLLGTGLLFIGSLKRR